MLDKARLLALKHGYLCGRRLYRWTQHARSAHTPELMGLRNMAVFYPYLDTRQRKLWRLEMGEQKGITGPYEPENGYGNRFWGLTPSSVESALRCAGFEVEQKFLRPFIGTFVCRAAGVRFAPVSGDWVVAGPG